MLKTLLLAVSLGAASPGVGDAPTLRPSAPAVTDRIAIPFDPPLGQPIVYRHTKSVVRGDQTTSVWMDYRYTFSRAGQGFLMRVEPLDAGVATPRLASAAQRQAFRRIWEMSVLPFTARLSAGAALEGLVDEEAYWESMIARTTELLRVAERGGDETALAFAGQVLRDMSPEARRALLMQQTAPIMEFSATDYSASEPEAVAYRFDSPFGGAIEQQATVTVASADAATATYEMAASVPGEELLASISNMIEQVPLNGRGRNTPEGRAQVLRELREAEMRMEAESRYEVDRLTGLARRFRIEQRVVVRTGSATTEQRQTLSAERRGQ